MRHRFALTAILFLFFGFFATAQPLVQPSAALAEPTSGKISGNIMDDKGLSLEAVTVALLRAGDSVRIRETVTNKAGRFVFSDVPD